MSQLSKWLDQEEIKDLPKTAEYFKKYKKSSISAVIIILLLLGIIIYQEGGF